MRNISHKRSLLPSALLGILLTALVHDPTSEPNALWDRASEETRLRERKGNERGGKEISGVKGKEGVR